MFTPEELSAIQKYIQHSTVLKQEAKDILCHFLEQGEPFPDELLAAVGFLIDVEEKYRESQIQKLQEKISLAKNEEELALKQWKAKEEEIADKLPKLFEEEALQSIQKINTIHQEFDTKQESQEQERESATIDAIRNKLSD